MSNEPENKYFKSALADFTFEMAVGAQIRHLMKLGLSEEEILPRLDYPISPAALHDAVEKYSDKARAAADGNDYEYVREFDEYGRASFRRVRRSTGSDEQIPHK